MKHLIQAMVFTLATLLHGVEPPLGVVGPEVAPVVGPEEGAEGGEAGVAWLGLRVAKVVPELRTQVPELPMGVGFVVETIEAGGPAAAAGLRKHDVIWKMDGQLLVNEAQFGVLLALRRPGEVVEMELFRAAKAERVKLTLGRAPPGFVMSVEQVGEQVVISPADRTMPVRIVDVPSRTATIENVDGRAVLARTDRGYELLITGPKGQMVWEGTVPRAGEPADVPVAWRERTVSMREALERASPCNRRSPRLRVVPPAESNTAKP